MMKKTYFILALVLPAFTWLQAQDKPADKPDMRYNISADGKHYIRFTFLNQVWLRWNESNPGTTVMGKPRDQTFDIGLRRTRMQLFGQVTDRVFFYTQFGMNNFNYLAGQNATNSGNRKLQAFFHDALGEYTVFKDKNYLRLGAGLTICNGLSRFTQPGIGSIMTLDVPVFAQSTVDQTDEFARKLSVYARGQVGRIDYRVALSDPFPITSNGAGAPVLGKDATFTTYGHTYQYQAFFAFNFFESEPHVTPYMQGTYLGKKKIFNLELGAIYQPDATWRLGEPNSSTGGNDTLFDNLLHASAALYLDMPLNTGKGTAFSAYLGYFYLDYGKNYVRNNGIMNPANGVVTNAAVASFNGPGNAYPMFGTGSYVYAQAGYLLKRDLLGGNGTLMPFVSAQYAQLQKIKDPVLVMDAGINWLINGHTGKLSLALQNRPVFRMQTNGDITQHVRKNCLMLQYQVFF